MSSYKLSLRCPIEYVMIEPDSADSACDAVTLMLVVPTTKELLTLVCSPFAIRRPAYCLWIIKSHSCDGKERRKWKEAEVERSGSGKKRKWKEAEVERSGSGMTDPHEAGPTRTLRFTHAGTAFLCYASCSVMHTFRNIRVGCCYLLTVFVSLSECRPI